MCIIILGLSVFLADIDIDISFLIAILFSIGKWCKHATVEKICTPLINSELKNFLCLLEA